MADFEFFKKQFEFRGKHAKMVSELSVLNDYEHTIFKRAVDVYVFAAIIGIRIDRKASEDYSPVETKKVFPEQMINAKEDLDFIMQMMIMLDDNPDKTDEEKVREAFKGAQTKEEYDQLIKKFNDYVRGGVEELYERLIIRKPGSEDGFYDERVANLMALYDRFAPKDEDETLKYVDNLI